MKTILKRVASRVPWWGKIATKLVLARLPIDYRRWKRVGLIQHGDMEEPAYAFRVFKFHFDSVRALRPGFIGLELGPGDSLFSSMAAHAFGSSAYHLVDVAAFAKDDLNRYQAMAEFLAHRGLRTLDVEGLTSLDAILAACRATYGTSGLASLRAIPAASVDFVWSHTVLQHIRHSEFLMTMRELRRVLRADGISSHWIDLQDCLGGALNNLRFSDSVWESPFMAKAGFYTNRLRCSEMLALFKEAGFQAEVIGAKRWDRLPTPRSKLWGRFRNVPDEDLCIRDFHVILRPV